MSRAVRRFTRTSPPLPLVGTTNGVIMASIVGALENQECINTFSYSAAVPAPTPAQLTTFGGNFYTAMAAAYRGFTSVDWLGSQILVNVVHRNDIMGVHNTSITALPGLAGTPHEPTMTAAVILRRSGVKGQHGRGRVSLPAVPQTWVTASILTAAGIAALQTVATAMMATVSDGTNTWTPCITQRSTVPPKLVVGFSPLVSCLVSSLLGTVRRRKVGRGQ